MKTATRVALILAGPALLLGVGLYRDHVRHRIPEQPPIALVVPAPLPECWRLDMEAREYRMGGWSARANGYEAEARMWFDLADETEAKPCKGERWEPEQ